MPIAALEVCPDPEAVAQRVAQRVLQARLAQPDRPLGLATGRTMEPVYRALVEAVQRWPQPQRQAVVAGWLSFNLDEYGLLGPAAAGSFAAFMERVLRLPLGLSAHQVRLPDGLAADPEAEAQRYAAEIAAAGGIGLQVLGLGSNGHVGFNEPPCGPDAPCRRVLLTQQTRRQNAAAFGGDPGAVPEWALTLGTREILAARELLLVVTGSAKADVLRRALQDPVSPDLPASWLQGHPQLQVIVDRAAAAQLSTALIAAQLG
ncbi:MAG: glucosamine-6-phosphate deaminase [Cyanobacteria bacterium K_DeepCast_35m_m2_023]|nr:glucosamine-6-phosphate deaminase [Cyanobacteria bacterium K_DeepCast_35m_m2_023]